MSKPPAWTGRSPSRSPSCDRLRPDLAGVLQGWFMNLTVKKAPPARRTSLAAPLDRRSS